MDEQTKGYEPTEEENTKKLNARIAELINEREGINETPDTMAMEDRMPYPLEAIETAIRLVDELGSNIGKLEGRLNVILLDSPIRKDDTEGEKAEPRSKLIERSHELHRRLCAAILHLDHINNRLDL